MGRLYVDAFVAACVAVDAIFAQAGVRGGMLLMELIGGAESVDEGRQATLAVGVREQVECLEALIEMGSEFSNCECGMGDTYDRFGEIGSVSMRLESFACVGSVLRRQVGREVIESP